LCTGDTQRTNTTENNRKTFLNYGGMCCPSPRDIRGNIIFLWGSFTLRPGVFPTLVIPARRRPCMWAARGWRGTCTPEGRSWRRRPWRSWTERCSLSTEEWPEEVTEKHGLNNAGTLSSCYLRIENAEGCVLIAVYLFICMRVTRITQKVLHRIAWNLVGWLVIIRGPFD